MEKLGNKFKSVIIVLVAMLSALAAFPFAANLFGIKQYSDDELSEVFAGNEPSDGFSPGTYVSTYPTVNSSVVYAGYSTGSAILASDVTFTSSYNSGWDNASSAMYAEYNLSIDGDDKDDLVFSNWLSRGAMEWETVPPGTYDVLIRLYFHSYLDAAGEYTYSDWKEIGTTTISRRSYNYISGSSLGHSSDVTNGTIQLKYTEFILGFNFTRAFPFTGEIYPNEYIGSHTGGDYATTNSSSTKPASDATTYASASAVTCITVGTYYLWFRYNNDWVSSDWIYTGVSVSVTKATNDIKRESLSDLSDRPVEVSYNTEKHYLPLSGSVVFRGGTTEYAVSTTTPTAASGTVVDDVSLLYAVNAGEYYLYAKTTGNATYLSTDWVKTKEAVLTITKGTLTLDDITCNVGHAPHDIVYGNNRQLFYYPQGAEPTVTGGLNGGSFVYGYSTVNGATGPSTTVSNLSDITSNLGAGTYTLWYKITGDNNWNDTGWFKGTSRVVPQADGTVPDGSVALSSGTLTGTEATYTGGDISLYKGSAEIINGNGTVYYFCTTGERPDDSVIGYKNINAVTMKTPGEYKLWCRLDGVNYTVGWTDTGVSSIIIKRDQVGSSKSFVDCVPLIVVASAVLVLIIIYSAFKRKRGF